MKKLPPVLCRNDSPSEVALFSPAKRLCQPTIRTRYERSATSIPAQMRGAKKKREAGRREADARPTLGLSEVDTRRPTHLAVSRSPPRTLRRGAASSLRREGCVELGRRAGVAWLLLLLTVVEQTNHKRLRNASHSQRYERKIERDVRAGCEKWSHAGCVVGTVVAAPQVTTLRRHERGAFSPS